MTAHLKEVCDLLGGGLMRCFAGDLAAEYEVGAAGGAEAALKLGGGSRELEFVLALRRPGAARALSARCSSAQGGRARSPAAPGLLAQREASPC